MLAVDELITMDQPNEASSSFEKDAPVLPNIFSILHKNFHGSDWANLLEDWENMLFSIGIGIIISLVFYYGTKKREMIPSGLQNFLETIAETLLNTILAIFGPKREKYLPFIGTLFVYIFCMNIIGIVPLMKSPSSSLNITAALAICVFCYVQYLHVRNRGILGYLYYLAGSPKDTVGWLISPLMFPIEMLTEITRPITLALRLFGNIFGEEIMIGIFALFGVTAIAALNLPLGLPLQLPFMLLAIFTSFIQALVFALLSSIYIALSGEGEEAH